MTQAGPHRLIAVVEDDKAVLNSLQFALEAEGYAVCAFESCADALTSPSIGGAECLVLDFALPDMDGVELLHVLRNRGLGCPAIIIASNPTARCRREAAASGAPLLEKPLMGEALTGQIRTLLGA